MPPQLVATTCATLSRRPSVAFITSYRRQLHPCGGRLSMAIACICGRSLPSHCRHPSHRAIHNSFSDYISLASPSPVNQQAGSPSNRTKIAEGREQPPISQSQASQGKSVQQQFTGLPCRTRPLAFLSISTRLHTYLFSKFVPSKPAVPSNSSCIFCHFFRGFYCQHPAEFISAPSQHFSIPYFSANSSPTSKEKTRLAMRHHPPAAATMFWWLILFFCQFVACLAAQSSSSLIKINNNNKKDIRAAVATNANSNIFCPARCECQQSGTARGHDDEEVADDERDDIHEEAEEEEQREDEVDNDDHHTFPGLSVRCLRASAINDSQFLALLQQLPLETRQLEIRCSTPAHAAADGSLQQKNATAAKPQLHWSDNINRLTRLRRLALVDCGVPALSQAVRLPLLSTLELGGNGLEQLQLGSFLGMPMLERLDLSRNRISALTTGAFIYLKNLRSLSLSHNRFGPELSTGSLLRGPRQLRVLELDGNRLNGRQLNDLFLDVGSLERLELNTCGLNDAEMWTLNWSAVPALKRLGLAGNNLTQVPSTSLRALASLSILDLGDNLIRSLGPCAFCGLNISRVFLGRNLLGLSARPFHREAFAETRLAELDLSSNHFRSFDSASLAGAQPWLEALHLSGNPLALEGALIWTLPRLRALHLADCGLGHLHYNSVPKEFAQLALLNLSANGLDHLPPNLGTMLPALQVLDISHNRFSSLPHTLWPFVDRLRLLYLHHCPWDCECAAQPLQLWMLQRLVLREQLRFEDTRCAEPALLRGQPLHRVQRINDCAVLFGANFGITQNTELVLILAALLVAAFLFSLVLILLLYCGREAKQKGTYRTGELQQQQSEKKLISSCGTTLDANVNGGGATLMSSSTNGRMGTLVRASQLDLDLSPPPHSRRVTSSNSTMSLLRGQHQQHQQQQHQQGGIWPSNSNNMLISPLTVQGLAMASSSSSAEENHHHHHQGQRNQPQQQKMGTLPCMSRMEKQPLLTEVPDLNHNIGECFDIDNIGTLRANIAGNGQLPAGLLVQSNGPRLPMPAGQQQQHGQQGQHVQQQRSTLLTF